MRSVFLIISLSIVGYWTTIILQGTTPKLDVYMEGYLRDIVSSEPAYMFGRYITDLGSKPFLVPFAIVMVLVLMVIFRDWLPGLMFAGGTLLTHGINQLIKIIIQRERPRIWIEASAEGYSFPSGHAMIPIVCYGLLVYFMSRKINNQFLRCLLYAFIGILIFLIGFSRYILNVHYMTDIISGFVFGCILLTMFIVLYKKIRMHKSN